jgi:hypothetical protein
MAMVERVSRFDEPAAPLKRPATGAASYVDWGAIIAGAILASAIAFVLLTFGSAVGLTLTSPFRGEGLAGTALAVAIALWVLWEKYPAFLREVIWPADCGDEYPTRLSMKPRSAMLAMVWSSGRLEP